MNLKLTVTWKRLLLLPVIGLVGALAVGWSGFVSIAANTGHFAVVEWFLHWTYENTVRTQSLAYSLPAGVDLADRALVQRAAGHFAGNCAVCHGAPGVLQSPALQAMTPTPPRLERQVGEWEDRELFWILKHGIKYSGMPAWTTQDRPDEVWAMVAFLRALPKMTAEDYRALAFGTNDAPAPVPGGVDRTDPASSAWPDIDLRATASGVAGPDPRTGFVQNDTAPPPEGPSVERPALTPARMSAGTQEALNDCARCHGMDGLGVDAGDAGAAFPIIAGQPQPYLFETLKAYASGRRESGIMTPAAGIHSEAVLAELATYYAELPAAAPAAAIASLTPAAPVMPGSAASAAPSVPEPASDAPRGVTLGEYGSARLPRGSVEVDAPASEPAPLGAEAQVDPAASSGPPYSAPGLAELGRRLAVEGWSDRKLPACDSCHGAAGREKNPHYPYLAGQPEWFIAAQLQLFKDRDRLGTPFAHLMEPIAINLTEEHIDALALYYSQQPAGAEAARR